MRALDAAKAYGLEEVALPEPPGFQAKVRLPSLSELMRKGAMPSELRRAILSQRGQAPDGEITDDQLDIGVDTTTLRAARMVRAVRMADGPWEQVTLSLDDFLELPGDTQMALLEIANGQKTPAMISALVNRRDGKITDDEAASIIEEETPKLVQAWDSFRPVRRGTGDAGNGDAVSPTPIRTPRAKRSNAGLRAG